MFDYQVMDEQEAMNERFKLLKEGEYDAVIQNSIDKVSANSGNHMIDLTLSVFDEEGRTHSVRDFLVFTKAMMWKVIHCANSAGVMDDYTNKRFCSDVIQGKRVRVKIVIEEGSEISVDKLNGKTLGSKYPSKNKVEDYIIVSEKVQFPDKMQEVEDIPF